MENTEQQPAPQPQAAAPAPETATPAASLDDITKYLAEFDRETKPAPQPTATESIPNAPAASSPAPNVPDAPATLEQAIKALDADTTYRTSQEMRAAMGNFASIVQGIQQQQIIERDRKDFEGVLAKAGKALEAQGLPASDEDVQRWFMSEAALNPELVSAFDRRYLSPEDRGRYSRQERKAFERLAESIRHRVDPDITAERNAIVAAVTKSGSYKAPKESPVDYGSLNDAEFRNELKKLGLT